MAGVRSVSGWQADDMGDWMENTIPNSDGLVIEVPDASNLPPEASALLKAFAISGIQPQPTVRGGFNGIRIVVGSPP